MRIRTPLVVAALAVPVVALRTVLRRRRSVDAPHERLRTSLLRRNSDVVRLGVTVGADYASTVGPARVNLRG